MICANCKPEVEVLNEEIATLRYQRDRAREELEAGRAMATQKFAEHSGLLLQNGDLEALSKEVVRLRAVEQLVPELVKALEPLTDSTEYADAPCHVGIVPAEKCARCSRHRAARAILAKARAS